MADQPSLALTGGPLLTFDPKHPSGVTIVIRGERIHAVGRAADLQAEVRGAAQVIDLAGRPCLPGFIDTHAHVVVTGMAHFVVDLSPVRTLGQCLGALKARVEGTRPGEWVVGYGLAAGLLEGAERRLPNRHELDALALDRPVFVGERTGHACALNSAGLATLDLPAGTPGIERDADGEALGILDGEANSLASAQTDLIFAGQIGYERLVAAACREALQAGLTTLHALDGAQAVNDPGVLALLARGERAAPRIVVYYQTREVEAAVRLGLPRIGGCGACWVDGAFTPHTARLLEPYADRPETSGRLYFGDEELLEFFRRAHKAGLQISVHCVGDGAVEQALRAYEAVLGESPRADHRHRIEHAELITADQMRRARAMGIVLAIQPAFNHFWRHDEFYPPLIGTERAARVDPVRSLIEAGLIVAGGSDSTVTPLRPLLGVHSAVNHSNPAERVDPLTALRLFTADAAYLAFEEGQKGSLTPGKLADTVVLGADPLAAGPAEIKDIPVEMTIVGGEVVYARE
jgi:hypothetical protein